MVPEEVRERKERIITSNRKAYHEYEIVQTFEAGIVLQGTEVKSLRSGKCSLQDAYAGFKTHDAEEIFAFNIHINPYEQGNRENHEPKRARKLLLNKREIIKIKTAVQEKSMTIIPLSIYFSGHLVKLKIALCRSKRKYDKREDTKKREVDREIHRKFRF
jgi:SsrA-binding protein